MTIESQAIACPGHHAWMELYGLQDACLHMLTQQDDAVAIFAPGWLLMLAIFVFIWWTGPHIMARQQ